MKDMLIFWIGLFWRLVTRKTVYFVVISNGELDVNKGDQFETSCFLPSKRQARDYINKNSKQLYENGRKYIVIEGACSGMFGYMADIEWYIYDCSIEQYIKWQAPIGFEDRIMLWT
jgi:hypothetical protein